MPSTSQTNVGFIHYDFAIAIVIVFVGVRKLSTAASDSNKHVISMNSWTGVLHTYDQAMRGQPSWETERVLYDQMAVFFEYLNGMMYKFTGNKLIAIKLVRSGVGADAGAARCRVHLATALLRPPSFHRPDRHQAHHAYILQIGLHLTQPRSLRTAPRISTIQDSMGGESRQMLVEA